MPAVSINLQVDPPKSINSSTASQVVPSTSSTKTLGEPYKKINKLDLPTFGRPTKATRR